MMPELWIYGSLGLICWIILASGLLMRSIPRREVSREIPKQPEPKLSPELITQIDSGIRYLKRALKPNPNYGYLVSKSSLLLGLGFREHHGEISIPAMDPESLILNFIRFLAQLPRLPRSLMIPVPPDLRLQLERLESKLESIAERERWENASMLGCFLEGIFRQWLPSISKDREMLQDLIHVMDGISERLRSVSYARMLRNLHSEEELAGLIQELKFQDEVSDLDQMLEKLESLKLTKLGSDGDHFRRLILIPGMELIREPRSSSQLKLRWNLCNALLRYLARFYG